MSFIQYDSNTVYVYIYSYIYIQNHYNHTSLHILAAKFSFTLFYINNKQVLILGNKKKKLAITKNMKKTFISPFSIRV